MKTKLKTHVYDIIIISLMSIIGILSVFHINSHLVFWNALKALIDSLVFYGKSLFANEPLSRSGVSFLIFDENLAKALLPLDFEVFGHRFIATFELLVNPDNIVLSWGSFLVFLTNFSRIALIIALPFLLFALAYHFIIFKKNTRPGDYKSKPVKFIEKTGYKVGRPVMLFLKNFFSKWKKNKWYKWITICLLAYNINVFSMILLFLACYFYFIFSFDFLALYFLVLKILICLSELIRPVFYPAWIVFTIGLITYIKILLGRRKLKDLLDKDIKIVKSAGMSIMTIGVPGTGKDSCNIIMAFIEQHILRTTAIDLLFEIRHEFPDFNWRAIEEMIEKKMSDPIKENQFMNKVQVEDHFRSWIERERFWEEKKDLLGYSLKKQRILFWDGLKQESIIEAIYDYAQIYYILISKLLESNYSIRVDKAVEITGHFPTYKWDPLKTNPRNLDSFHRSTPFDFNEMRIIKPVVDENNPDSQTVLFDAGIMMISEYEKERGNRYTNQSRTFDTTSPSQDGTPVFNALIRHLTTVRHHCFGRIIMNGQDLNTLSGREIKMVETVMFIAPEKRKLKTALPLFWLENTILEWANEFFTVRDIKYSELRNDKSVYSWIVAKAASFFGWINRLINSNFGYESVPLTMSGANLDGSQVNKGQGMFNLIHKIPYSDVYYTDINKEYWKKAKIMAVSGINQRPEFSGPLATAEELKSMHGYLPAELALAAENLESRITQIRALHKEEKTNDKEESGH